MPRSTTAGDRTDGLVRARKVDRPDAVVEVIGDVERVAGCRYTARKVEPCRCARTVDMCAETSTTGYDRADLRRGCVNGTDGMIGLVSNVERSTALRDSI